MKRILTTVVLTCAASSAYAYPVKPVRMVVAQAAGGNADLVARAVAMKMGEALKQQFVVDNRPGGAGVIGAETVARAVPDGYTLLLASSAFGVNPSLTKLPYDPINGFAPITLVAFAPNLLVVHPAVPVKTVPELITYAKSKPGQLRYASAGNGTAPHMSGELFNLMAGTKMIHVPYKGNGPALVDVLGGHVELTFASLPAGLPHGKSGKLRMVAVTSLKRSTIMPELPTVAEAGLSGFDTDQWYGVLGPANLPEPLLARLSKETIAATKSKSFVDKARAQGFEVVGGTPTQFRTHITTEVAKWKDLVKRANIQVE